MAVISADPSIGTMLVLALGRMVDPVGEVSGTRSHDTATTAATTVKATVEVGTASLPEGSEPSDGAKDEGGWNVTVEGLLKIIES